MQLIGWRDEKTKDNYQGKYFRDLFNEPRPYADQRDIPPTEGPVKEILYEQIDSEEK